MESRPYVSIVIPVYNGSNYLGEAIDSALAQTYPNIEVIVVDDGSDDGGKSEKIVLSYGNRVRYIRKENGGVASALNLGIREMRGEYFSWLSHDDVYRPEKVEAQVECLAHMGRDAILYGDYELIDERGRFLETVRTGHMTARDFRMALITDIAVNGCTTLVPKCFFETVGVFDERLRTNQDYDLWFRMASRYTFVHVHRILIGSRVHPGQGTRRMADTCLAEGNAYFMRCLDAIAADYAAGGCPGWLHRFFFMAAVRLKRRAYFPASQHSLELYLRHSAEGAPGSAVRRAIAYGYLDICDSFPVRKAIGLPGYLGRKWDRLRRICGRQSWPARRT
ncbi:MAG: glycosyltransferase [Deltaproteobacteria bacterium]|nr:glycosyltransferase [Deltaproteobacteria bacterium]